MTHAEHESLLSPREQQIAALISQGMTNREISEELSLSVFTVRNQVINILRKLDLKNRTEIAREIAEEVLSGTDVGWLATCDGDQPRVRPLNIAIRLLLPAEEASRSRDQMVTIQ